MFPLPTKLLGDCWGLLDTIEKIIKIIIYYGLSSCIEIENRLFEGEYGFRCGNCAMSAIIIRTNLARGAVYSAACFVVLELNVPTQSTRSKLKVHWL